MTDSVLKPMAVLFAICLVVSAALAVTYGATKDRIAESEARAANEARAEVLPGAVFEQVTADGTATGGTAADGTAAAATQASTPVYPMVTGLYRALGVSDGARAGYVADVTVQGYGGELTVIVGIGVDMKVTGVRVTEHSETPGLGANAATPAFYGQFSGKDAASGLNRVKGAAASDSDIAAISGATITSDAVVSAVNAAVAAIADVN